MTTESSTAIATGKPARRRPTRGPRLAVGQRFGSLVLESFAGGDRAMKYAWNCRCDCGGSTRSIEYALIYSGIESCGCVGNARWRDKHMSAARDAYAGKIFGWLMVDEIHPALPGLTSRSLSASTFCACGSPAPKMIPLSQLITGHSSSCCRIRSNTIDAVRVRFDVLTQFRDGDAAHYHHRHRIVRSLVAEGYLAPRTLELTELGRRTLAEGIASMLPDHLSTFGSYVGKAAGWLTITEILPADDPTTTNMRIRASCKCGSTPNFTGVLKDLKMSRVSCDECIPDGGKRPDEFVYDVLTQVASGEALFAPSNKIFRLLSRRAYFDLEARVITAQGREFMRSFASSRTV